MHWERSRQRGKPGAQRWTEFARGGHRAVDRQVGHRDPRRGEACETPVIADVVVVGVRAEHGERKVRQAPGDRRYVTPAGHGVEEQRALLTQQQVLVVALPVTPLPDGERSVIAPVDREPTVVKVWMPR
jgi:hypothetical protein